MCPPDLALNELFKIMIVQEKKPEFIEQPRMRIALEGFHSLVQRIF
jgi:hypothetical protein